MFLVVGVVRMTACVWLVVEQFGAELFVVEYVKKGGFIKDLVSVFRSEFRVKTHYDDSRISLY